MGWTAASVTKLAPRRAVLVAGAAAVAVTVGTGAAVTEAAAMAATTAETGAAAVGGVAVTAASDGRFKANVVFVVALPLVATACVLIGARLEAEALPMMLP